MYLGYIPNIYIYIFVLQSFPNFRFWLLYFYKEIKETWKIQLYLSTDHESCRFEHRFIWSFVLVELRKASFQWGFVFCQEAQDFWMGTFLCSQVLIWDPTTDLGHIIAYSLIHFILQFCFCMKMTYLDNTKWCLNSFSR